MPELLTPNRRAERVDSTTAPAITVRCLGSEIWISREARLVAGAWLRNVGAEVAHHIAIPDVLIDDGVWCRFGTVDDLEPGEEASLDPVICLAADKTHPEHATLAGLISRTVVAQAIEDRARCRQWTFRVTYQDGKKRRYESCCEIEVASLPLTLRISSTRVSRSDGRS